MKKRTDRAIAIGSIATVVVVPTVMLVAVKTGAVQIPGLENQGPVGSISAEKAPKKAKTSPTPSAPASPALQQAGPPVPVVKAVTKSKTSKAATTTSRFLPASDGAAITSVKWVSDRGFDITVKSPALASSRQVRVLVPKAWRVKSTRTWPTVYALHGGNDRYVSWTRSTDIAKVAAGYDTMVVMPEGANGSYTDWYNGGRGGNPRWETFHTLEVRELVERNFHAGTSRAVMGISSGAQGAITYAARHPGMYKYAAAYSGVLSMLMPGVPSLLIYINSNKGVDPYSIWGDPVVNLRNWKAHDPATLVPKLRGTGLYVSSGNGTAGPFDDPGKAEWDIRYLSEKQVDRTSQDFVEKAKALGIPVTANFYGAGSHTWPYWKREMHANWPAIMTSIGAPSLSAAAAPPAPAPLSTVPPAS